MPIISTLSSTLSSSSFVLGLGIGVASTTLVSKYLYKQVRDRAQLDIEDNESGGMDIIVSRLDHVSWNIPDDDTPCLVKSVTESCNISCCWIMQLCCSVVLVIVRIRIFSRDRDLTTSSVRPYVRDQNLSSTIHNIIESPMVANSH